MKRIYIFILVLSLFSAVNAQKNYPILSLEGIGAACILDQDPIMFVVENADGIANLAYYDLEKKELVQRFSAKLPDKPVSHLIPGDNGLLYLICTREDDETGRPIFDAIYSFDYIKDKIKEVYTESERVRTPRIAAAVNTLLVFGNSPFKDPPRLFDLESGKFKAFSDDENLRMLCSSDDHNSFVVFRYNEINEDETVPLYVMDKDGNLSDRIGVYDSRLVASTDEEKNHLPGIKLSQQDYDWVIDAYDNSGFPLSGFSIAMHPGIVERYEKTAYLFESREVSAANKTYLAARGTHQFWVYNTENPNPMKPKTISDEDMASILSYLDEKTEYIKTPIQSAALDKVFEAGFFSITVKQKMGDSGFSESTFIVFKQADSFDVLINKSMLTRLISPSFKITNEQSASAFQDALNALYPPGTFDKKHIQCYSKENSWIYVRGTSFGEKNGFIVELMPDQTIKSIEFTNKIIQ